MSSENAMQLRLVYYNVVERSVSTATLDVTPDISLRDLFENAGFPSAEIDLNRYYPVRDAYSTHGQVLPYVVSEGKVRWQVFYSDVTLDDVVATLGIADEPLHVHVGIPQAGGPDVTDIVVLWRQFYHAIEAIDPVLGVGGGILGIVAFLRRAISSRRGRVPPDALASAAPGAVFSFVLRQREWDAGELAETAGITRKDATNLLRLCRYRWHSRSRKYRRTADTERVIAALNEVEQYDE